MQIVGFGEASLRPAQHDATVVHGLDAKRLLFATFSSRVQQTSGHRLCTLSAKS